MIKSVGGFMLMTNDEWRMTKEARNPKSEIRKRSGSRTAALQNLAAWFALPTADFGFLSSFLLRIGFGFYHVSDGQNERKDAALVHDGFDGQSRFEFPGQFIDHG